jgi:hypothetical protein
MRVILIGDSNVARVREAMRTLDSGLELRIISVGAQSDAVWEVYLQRRAEFQHFQPDMIVVHMGHNDAVWHPRRNRVPRHPMEVFGIVSGYIGQIQTDFPQSKVIQSNLFPRNIGPHLYGLPLYRYNMMVYEFGLVLRDQSLERNRNIVLNRVMWEKPSEGLANAMMFENDGLHLNFCGSCSVAAAWLRVFRR